MRCAILLQSYDFKIEYRPGRLNEYADALFKREYPTSTPTENIMFIKPPDEINNNKINIHQRADQRMMDKTNYLKDKTLPDDQKQSNKDFIDIDHYFLGDNESLYHVSETRKSCNYGFHK